jgi:hypothetical protein
MLRRGDTTETATFMIIGGRMCQEKNEAVDEVLAEFGVKCIILSKNSIKRFTPKAARLIGFIRGGRVDFSPFVRKRKQNHAEEKAKGSLSASGSPSRSRTHLSSLTARLSSASSAASPASGAAERSMATSGSTAAASLRRCLADALVRRRTSRAASTSPARTRSTSARSAAASDGRSAAASGGGEAGDASPEEHASGDSIFDCRDRGSRCGTGSAGPCRASLRLCVCERARGRETGSEVGATALLLIAVKSGQGRATETGG